MRFAIGYPIGRLNAPDEMFTQEAIAEIARAAERAGIDAMSLTEHPATPDAWRDHNGHESIDPFVGLSFVAAATTRLRLLTFLVVVPYHNPFMLAKTTASLDRLSGGRLILGVGVGYLEGEFAALGVPFDERNRRFAETMDVLPRAWSGQPVHAVGSTFDGDGIVTRPVPATLPGPPIWIGGNSALTRRRVAQYGDGWMPIPTNAAQEVRRKTAQLESIERLSAQIRELQDERERLGRLRPAEIKFMIQDIDPRTETDRYVERVAQLQKAGVGWLTLETPSGSRAEVMEHLEWFDTELRPLVSVEQERLAPPVRDDDRAAIVDLHHSYARAVDRNEFELLRQVFSPDVVAEYADRRVEGVEAVIDMLAKSHSTMSHTRHRMLDFEIACCGDRATSRVAKRNTLTSRPDGSSPDGVESVVVGHYLDDLVRTEDGWRIVRRTSNHLSM